MWKHDGHRPHSRGCARVNSKGVRLMRNRARFSEESLASVGDATVRE